jgi:hypothetical protein
MEGNGQFHSIAQGIEINTRRGRRCVGGLSEVPPQKKDFKKLGPKNYNKVQQ